MFDWMGNPVLNTVYTLLLFEAFERPATYGEFPQVWTTGGSDHSCSRIWTLEPHERTCMMFENMVIVECCQSSGKRMVIHCEFWWQIVICWLSITICRILQMLWLLPFVWVFWLLGHHWLVIIPIGESTTQSHPTSPCHSPVSFTKTLSPRLIEISLDACWKSHVGCMLDAYWMQSMPSPALIMCLLQRAPSCSQISWPFGGAVVCQLVQQVAKATDRHCQLKLLERKQIERCQQSTATESYETIARQGHFSTLYKAT